MRNTKRMCDSLLHTFLLCHEFSIAAEQNVGAPAGHVGGNRHRLLAARLSHDFGFALMVLGIQHDVLDTLLLQQLGDAF